MSNLSELLPTGGGQNAVDFVASGTLGSGITVALKADGTVEAVSETVNSQDIPIVNATTFANQATQYLRLKADPHNANRWAAVWTDDAGTKYVRVAIFTRSGSSVTVSPISNAYTSGNASLPIICFDPNTEGKFLLTFNNVSNYTSSIVGTFSGSAGSETFSYGTLLNQWDTSWRCFYGADMHPTATAGDFILVAGDNISSYLKARILRVSGTTVTAVGSTTVLDSNFAYTVNSAMNPTNANEGLAAFMNYTTNTFYFGGIFSISGTTITLGTKYAIDSGISYSINYDPYQSLAAVNASQYILSGVNNSNQRLYAMSITNSSGVLTNTTPVLVSTLYNGAIGYYSISNNLSDPNTFIIAFRDRSYNRAFCTVGTLSGTTITINTNVNLGAANTNLKFYYSVAQQSGETGSFLLVGGDASLIAQYVLGETGGTSTNSADFIGITAEAISDTATGPVNVYGGINEAQTGLTIGSDYYVQNNGSISTTASAVKTGQAISATTINMMDLT